LESNSAGEGVGVAVGVGVRVAVGVRVGVGVRVSVHVNVSPEVASGVGACLAQEARTRAARNVRTVIFFMLGSPE
jgi:NF-X1-type zinc finger protein NFXL1